MKIHIIGCSGSGKTYLAKELSKKYGIPHFDLDDIQWDNSTNSYGVKMPVEKRSALFSEILKNDNWIIEGVYYTWVQHSFENANRIYVLDMPEYLYIWRIVIRFFRRKIGIEKGKKETFRSVLNLIKWTNTFQKNNFPEIKSILKKYNDKVIYLSNKKDVNNIIHYNDTI